MSDYPEHDKLTAINEQSQICGEFLEWLNQQSIQLCVIPDEYDHTYLPISTNWQDLLADFFNINPRKLESEKRQMLALLRRDVT